MQAIEYYADVLSDGHISLPQRAVEELCLSKGKKVKVILLSEWLNESTKEDENSKLRDKMEKLKRKEISFAELSVCGIWADREDMKESVGWVNQLRADVNERQGRLGLE